MTTRKREDDDEIDGPNNNHNNNNEDTKRLKTTTKSSSLLLWDIPTSSHYEVSLMHRHVVSSVVSSPKHGFVMTASDDGIVNFWKRLSSKACLEFAKSFTAHAGPVLNLTMSASGDTACSVGADGVLKTYDVSTFDVSGMIASQSKELGPHLCFCASDDLVAVSCDSDIMVFSTVTLSPEPVKVIKLHAKPITCMALNPYRNCMISGDQSGILELWDASTDRLGSAVTFADNGVSWKSKISDTQLYALLKKKTYGIAIATCEKHFCVYGKDQKIRVYNHATCRIQVTYDERPKVYQAPLDAGKDSSYGMDAIEYGKRAATERELSESLAMTGGVFTENTMMDSSKQLLGIAFDPTGKYLLIPTLLGIKLLEWQRNRLVKIIGKSEAHHLRFISVALCHGDAKVNYQMQLARSGGSNVAVSEEKEKVSDALLIALAFKKRRLYVFSHRDPMDRATTEEEQGDILLARDVMNEPPDADDRFMMEPSSSITKSKLGKEAVLRTTMGDIHIKLFENEVPKTIENFCGHARSGYYDNVIFHRIIKGFMIQTGDPLGDGTGGESIWGGEFEDEFVRDLRHDRPFTVSMANAGPNTNGSQFFITTVPTPWLDNKHTVFGRVTKGMDVCTAMEAVKTDDLDKPLEEISIQSVDIM